MLLHSALSPAITPLATGLSLNHSLCSCQGAGAASADCSASTVSFRRSFRLTNPENDTEPSTLRINSFRDAVRLLSTHPLRCLTRMTFMLALSLTASTAESLAILADRP